MAPQLPSIPRNLPRKFPEDHELLCKITGAAAGTESFIAGWGDTSINESLVSCDAFDTAPGSNGFLAWSQVTPVCHLLVLTWLNRTNGITSSLLTMVKPSPLIWMVSK